MAKTLSGDPEKLSSLNESSLGMSFLATGPIILGIAVAFALAFRDLPLWGVWLALAGILFVVRVVWIAFAVLSRRARHVLIAVGWAPIFYYIGYNWLLLMDFYS